MSAVFTAQTKKGRTWRPSQWILETTSRRHYGSQAGGAGTEGFTTLSNLVNYGWLAIATVTAQAQHSLQLSPI
jgi:hypothetical protein